MMSSHGKPSATGGGFYEEHSGSLYEDVIARADQANVKTEELKRLVSKELHSERMKIQICDTRQGLDLQLASTSKEWSEAAYTALDAGLISEEAWKQRRNHGVYKFGANVQKFANNLAKVVDAYSGIVDVVVKAGGPYGSAGYTALSCLLAFAVNKSKSDEMISKSLEHMHNFFPRINLLAEIYELDKIIAGYVVNVHRNMVFFARDASLYFVKKSKRFMASITPASMAVDKRVEQIKASLIEISEWSNVFLHRNADQLLKKQATLQSGVDNIQRQNVELEKAHKEIEDKILAAQSELNNLHRKVDGLKTELKEISEMERGNQSRMDQDNLQGMRLSLGCPDRGLHGDLEKCSDNIRRVFFHKAGSPKARANYTRMTLEKLKDEDCYQRWDTNAITKLLLVGGTTIPESRSGPNGSSSYSWLSPAAVDMASTLRKGNNRVAFFTCHPDTVTQSKTSLAEVIADTLFQIARCDPPMLRGEFFRHSSTNLLEVWKSQDDVEEMVQFAQRMFIIASAQHRLYLIIDRLDYCDSKPVNILKCLTSIIAPPSCNVKIFATWNTVDASIEKDCEYFIEVSKNAATGKMKFNQAKGHASSGHLGRQD